MKDFDIIEHNATTCKFCGSIPFIIERGDFRKYECLQPDCKIKNNNSTGFCIPKSYSLNKWNKKNRVKDHKMIEMYERKRSRFRFFQFITMGLFIGITLALITVFIIHIFILR